MTIQDPRIQYEIERLQNVSDFDALAMLNRLETIWRFIASQQRRISELEARLVTTEEAIKADGERLSDSEWFASDL